MTLSALKVSEVNKYIKQLLLTDMILSNISVEGEISNFKHHSSGHMYFNLKDDKGKIKSVIFKRDNANMTFRPEEGMKVIATGYVSIYDREGEYQLYVRHLKMSGQGDLYRQFEELKVKLEKEGLFRDESKKTISFLPNNVGVVTSSTGAAVRDIINVLHRRCPITNIIIYQSAVQGQAAPANICEGLRYLDGRGDIDTIITGRGGGSIEELFAFNDEEVARTIHSLKTPIISAVGHETDFTIADFVADLRAATPSEAAELAVPDIRSLLHDIDYKYNKINRLMVKQIENHKTELRHINAGMKYFSPLNNLKNKRNKLMNLFKDLSFEKERIFESQMLKLLEIKGKLDLLDPSLGLDKGFGLLVDLENNLIRSVAGLNVNDNIEIILKDGKLKATINNIEKRDIVDG